MDKKLSDQELEIFFKAWTDEAVQLQLAGTIKTSRVCFFFSIWQGFCKRPALTGCQVNAETKSKNVKSNYGVKTF